MLFFFVYKYTTDYQPIILKSQKAKNLQMYQTAHTRAYINILPPSLTIIKCVNYRFNSIF